MKYLFIELYYGDGRYLTEKEFHEQKEGMRVVVNDGVTVYMGEESIIAVIESENA